MKQFEKEFPKRILVIQLRQLGDVLLTTPSLRALRSRFPSSIIAFLVDSAFEPLLRFNPDLDLILAREPGEKFEAIKTLRQVRSFAPDLVIDYLANPRTTLLSVCSGANLTISYANKRRARFYKRAVVPEGSYVAQEKLSLLAPLGIDWKSQSLDLVFNFPARAKVRVEKILERFETSGEDFIVVIDLFHKRPARQWAPENFLEIADRLKEEFQAKVIITCLDENRSRAEKLLRDRKSAHYLAPSLSLFELGALISRANLFLGGDAGAKHIAVSQNTPSFTILGPSGEQWTPPSYLHQTIFLNLDCRPCSHHICPKPDHPCMSQLSPDLVWERLKEFIFQIKAGN